MTTHKFNDTDIVGFAINCGIEVHLYLDAEHLYEARGDEGISMVSLSAEDISTIADRLGFDLVSRPNAIKF